MAQIKTGSAAKAAFAIAAALVVLASLSGSGVVGWMVAPFVLGLALFAIARAALSDTMLVLMFLALTLENPAEIPAAGEWSSPFITFGGLMLTHLKTIIGGPWFFGGMDMMLIAAMIVAWSRGGGLSNTPRPMVKLAYLSLLTVPWVFLVGKIRGGDDPSASVWQADRVTYLPILFLLFASALRGPNDHIRVGKVILAAGTLRALQSLFVKAIVDVKPDALTGEATLVYTTTHNDSITFALTTVLLVALLIQRAGKKATRLVLLLLPILLGGMWANNRRMVWVQVILVLATVYLMTEANPFKRKLQRWLLMLSPIAIGYIAVGWESSAKIFKPVQTIRSAIEPDTDGSTLWREIENYDLIATIHNFPIFGLGYGHKFWEIIPLPAVDYVFEFYIPHNSILGLWCFYGLVGVMGITMLWVAGVYFGIRAYHFSKLPLDKAACIVSFASVLVYLVQCFGDMGLGCWAGVFTVAPCLAVACKLAVSSGAWPMNGSSSARVDQARASAPPAAQAPRRGAA